MTAQDWLTLQEQLWSVFAPLVGWFLAFVTAATVGVASLAFGSIYFADWLDGA